MQTDARTHRQTDTHTHTHLSLSLTPIIDPSNRHVRLFFFWFSAFQVTVVERRQNFTRFNILHLWDWVCADLIALGANPSDILGKSFFHIGTKNLQMMLCRMALLLGVQVVTGVQAKAMQPPLEEDPNRIKLWRLEAEHLQQGVRLFIPCHALFVASGASDPFAQALGFEQVEMGTRFVHVNACVNACLCERYFGCVVFLIRFTAAHIHTHMHTHTRALARLLACCMLRQQCNGPCCALEEHKEPTGAAA